MTKSKDAWCEQAYDVFTEGYAKIAHDLWKEIHFGPPYYRGVEGAKEELIKRINSLSVAEKAIYGVEYGD